MLPGCVRRRRCPRQGRGHPRRKAAAASRQRPTRWRGCWSTCRWPTSTAPSTTPSRRRWPTTPVPGARVKVRFAGQDVDGFVSSARRAPTTPAASAAAPGRERRAGAHARGRPARGRRRRALRRRAVRRAAARRAAAARHHREGALARCPAPARRHRRSHPRPGRSSSTPRPSCATWPTAGAPRAVWSAAPADDWPALVAEAVAATTAAGRGALVCVPDRQDVARVDAALTAVLARATTCASPPTPGRRRATATSWPSRAAPPGRRRHPRGGVRARARPGAGRAAGTTATTCTPSPARPTPTPARCCCPCRAAGRRRAPRRVRAQRRGAAAGRRPAGPTSWRLREDGAAPPGAGRGGAAPSDRARARHPHARARPTTPSGVALATGPVLVQTPRAGYAASLACERVPHPGSLLGLHRAARAGRPGPAAAVPLVRPRRDGLGLRDVRRPRPARARTSARRAPPRSSAGRSPAPRCARSGGDRVLADVGSSSPRIVVATAGAEPVADGGYAAVVLLDTWLTAGARRPACRRGGRCAAGSTRSALVRPGGRVVAVGDPAHPALQALVRWDPAGFARSRGGRARPGPPAPGRPDGHRDRRPRSRRRRPHPARPARRRGGARAGAGRDDERAGCSLRVPRAPRRGPVPRRSATCSGCARPASSTPYASRSTRSSI